MFLLKGIFKGEEVIAKVFHSGARLANNVWRRTISLHRSILLRHKSIHGLMFADWLNYPTEKYLSTLKNNCSYTTSVVPSPCALLIGEKCSYGTLKDLLSNNIPDVVSCKHPTAFENCDMIGYINDHFNTACNSEVTRLRMLMEIANSLARGLWFLHSVATEDTLATVFLNFTAGDSGAASLLKAEANYQRLLLTVHHHIYSQT
ncbi:unnamed protein product [Trichobilharzia regenti]|nr:unnamed protein product [Trichobilharzia regenti]